jgi:hypothetical protein
VTGLTTTDEREAALLRAGADGWAVLSIGPLPEGQPTPQGFSTALVARWHAQFRPPPAPAPPPTQPEPDPDAPPQPTVCAEAPTMSPDGEVPAEVVCEDELILL